MAQIPSSRLTNCTFCHEPLDTNAKGTWQVVKGWCPIARYSGNKLGTNSVSLVKWFEHWACDNCISKVKKGIPVGQQEIPFFDLADGE